MMTKTRIFPVWLTCLVIVGCLAVGSVLPSTLADEGGESKDGAPPSNVMNMLRQGLPKPASQNILRADPDAILGIVENGRLRPLYPAHPDLVFPLRLTRIARQEARPPESAQIDLLSHEGKVILVQGEPDSGWLYRARIVEVGGPILTLLAKQLFAKRTPKKCFTTPGRR